MLWVTARVCEVSAVTKLMKRATAARKCFRTNSLNCIYPVMASLERRVPTLASPGESPRYLRRRIKPYRCCWSSTIKMLIVARCSARTTKTELVQPCLKLIWMILLKGTFFEKENTLCWRVTKNQKKQLTSLADTCCCEPCMIRLGLQCNHPINIMVLNKSTLTQGVHYFYHMLPPNTTWRVKTCKIH